MQSWTPPQRPAAYAEQALLTAIIDGSFPPGTTLPAERELSRLLGVTRPTLREALRRLEADGWLEVKQGKLTRVKDFWKGGGLNVLSSLVQFSEELPPDFIPNLLEVRLALAPAYVRKAVERDSSSVFVFLGESKRLALEPEVLASFDWRLHHTMTLLSGNPIYTLILNGFGGFYQQMACRYFERAEAREASCAFYEALLVAARLGLAAEAEVITRTVMQESIELWMRTSVPSDIIP